MKTKTRLWGLILISCVMLISCGDDDGTPALKPAPVEKIDSIVYVYSIPIEGVVGNDKNGNMNSKVPFVLTLSDVIGAEKANNFIQNSANNYQRGKMFVKIRGLSAIDNITLKDFKIKVGNRLYNLGDCNPTATATTPNGTASFSDKELSADIYTDISRDVYNAIISSQKKAEVRIEFSTTKSIVLETYPVFLDIKIFGYYKYNTYPTEK